MKTIEAKDLKIGDKYKSGKSVQIVVEIERVSDKAITFHTNRVSPNPYNAPLFQRKRLNTKIELV